MDPPHIDRSVFVRDWFFGRFVFGTWAINKRENLLGVFTNGAVGARFTVGAICGPRFLHKTLPTQPQKNDRQAAAENQKSGRDCGIFLKEALVRPRFSGTDEAGIFQRVQRKVLALALRGACDFH